MTLFEKIQKIKVDLVEANLKKTGKNTFSNYDYFQLADFMPTVITSCEKNKVCTWTSFTETTGFLYAVDSEKPSDELVVTCPLTMFELKGANKMQVLGGIQTYARRYLYMALLDIVEDDAFEGGTGAKKTPAKKAEATPLAKKQKSVSDVAKKIIATGVSKDDVYAVIMKHSDGNKNPNNIKTEDACDAILKELKTMEG